MNSDIVSELCYNHENYDKMKTEMLRPALVNQEIKIGEYSHRIYWLM